MQFRLRLFRLHLAASATVLTVVLGGLYLGWYHWPGWFLAIATPVIVVMAGVDLALGPLLTLIVASPGKKRAVLARDISIIAAVQLLALLYGSIQLWGGRPLYYVYSGGILQMVQAYDIDPDDAALADAQHSSFAPHWYSLPRWVWSPTPAGPPPAAGVDLSTMPRTFRPWEAGLQDLRPQLQPIDAQKFFIFNEKGALKARMLKDGLHPEERNTIAMTGRGRPVLVVFDPKTMKIEAMLKPD